MKGFIRSAPSNGCWKTRGAAWCIILCLRYERGEPEKRDRLWKTEWKGNEIIRNENARRSEERATHRASSADMQRPKNTENEIVPHSPFSGRLLPFPLYIPAPHDPPSSYLSPSAGEYWIFKTFLAQGDGGGGGAARGAARDGEKFLVWPGRKRARASFLLSAARLFPPPTCLYAPVERFLRARARERETTRSSRRARARVLFYYPFLILLLFEKHTFLSAASGDAFQARIVTRVHRVVVPVSWWLFFPFSSGASLSPLLLCIYPPYCCFGYMTRRRSMQMFCSLPPTTLMLLLQVRLSGTLAVIRREYLQPSPLRGARVQRGGESFGNWA